jgi:hypothetical protein
VGGGVHLPGDVILGAVIRWALGVVLAAVLGPEAVFVHLLALVAPVAIVGRLVGVLPARVVLVARPCCRRRDRRYSAIAPRHRSQ